MIGGTQLYQLGHGLRQGGKIIKQNSGLTRVQLPDGTFVQYRTKMSDSPQSVATVDIKSPLFNQGTKDIKIKFNP